MSNSGVVLAGRYRLADRIAAGGAGEVWRAADLVLERPVAVKLLRAEYAQHGETLARFRAEARHAGALSHPGIAQVYDYGEAGPADPPYLVLELVDGPSLAGLLASGPLDPARTMDVVAQAAAGLQAAHAAGLVHRDIKPGNLLLAPDGQVKITDFGIAHAAGSAPLTRTGTLIGTPAYLAPERAAGGSATPASDLYSLGVVAFECLAGAPPFSGTPLEVAAANAYQPLPPLPEAPAGVAALIGELTAKDPAARPATAGEVGQRAARLRDAAAAGGQDAGLAAASPVPAGPGPGGTHPGSDPAPGGPAATLALGPDPAVADAGAPARPATGWRGRRAGGPERPGMRPGLPRRAVLAGAAAVVAIGLAGWLLAAALTGAPARRPPAAPHRGAATRMVEVNSAVLAGRPAGQVARLLRLRGLRPSVVWVKGSTLPPGRVVSVRPSGQVPAGSTVVIVAAAGSPAGHHGPGHGGKPGKEHGPGKGGGKGEG